MMKSIICALLKQCSAQEEKCYSDYFAIFFACAGLAVLMAANYIYFYLENQAIGDLMIYSAALSSLSLMLKIYSHYSKKKSAYEIASCNIMNGIGKIIPYAPLIIRYVPLSLISFVAVNLIKSKVLRGVQKVIR